MITLNQSSTLDIFIRGGYFTNVSTVVITPQNIVGSPIIVNSVNVIDDDEIIVNITTPAVDDIHDVTVTNESGGTTVTSPIEVVLSGWVDLRLGGDVLTSGNAAGNDIRHNTAFSINRTTTGMSFSGLGPWGSWIKFESMAWNRGDNKRLQIILTSPNDTSGSMMAGIFSDQTNEASTQQYYQGEVLAYFQNLNIVWGLFGNSGSPGSAANQQVTTGINGANRVYKLIFENDGGVGSNFSMYQIPDGLPSSWDDTSNLITSFTVGGTLNPSQSLIMPGLIPANGGGQEYISIKVD